MLPDPVAAVGQVLGPFFIGNAAKLSNVSVMVSEVALPVESGRVKPMTVSNPR